MISVLIISTDSELTRVLSSALVDQGMTPLVAASAGEATRVYSDKTPDLLLVDLDGASPRSYDVAGIRGLNGHVPMVALLSRGSLGSSDIAVMDDFILKPSTPEEAIARVRHVLSRSGNPDLQETIECGDLVVNVGNYEVTLGGEPLDLTYKEYELLKFLASNRGRVYSREALLNRVWGYNYYGGERTVDVHIRRLRSKLEEGGRTYIETVRNIGYRFKKIP